MKPLFIPLKTEYFEAFKAGTKDTEYRRHGSRWNEDVCQVGRPAGLRVSRFDSLNHRLVSINNWTACLPVRFQ